LRVPQIAAHPADAPKAIYPFVRASDFRKDPIPLLGSMLYVKGPNFQ